MKIRFMSGKSLMTYATNAGYLDRNAGSLVKNVKINREARVTGYLGDRAVEWAYKAIQVMSGETPEAGRAKARNCFLFVALLMTGARLSELVEERYTLRKIADGGLTWLETSRAGCR